MKEIKARAKAMHEKREAGYGTHSTSRHPGKAGGGHSDAAEDRAMIKNMVKPAALNRAGGGSIARLGDLMGKDTSNPSSLAKDPKTNPGAEKQGFGYKSGGKPKKGKTHINIIVGQPKAEGQGQPVPVPVPVPAGGAGGMPPAGPMAAKPPMPGGPMAGVGALGGTAGLPRKKGGMVHLTGGAGGGRGRLQKNHMR
jgi:hypothetical protein